MMLAMLLAALPVQAEFTIDAAGFTADVYAHKAGDPVQPIGIVFIPGKGGNPEAGYLNSFYRKLNRAGYEVIAPVMPWRKWDGDRRQAMAVISNLIDYYAGKDKKVVLAGHSMGAMLAMHYAAEQPADNLLAVVAIAPGHLIHQSGLFKRATKESIQRARAMQAAGEGDDTGEFTDIKQGKEYTRTTTAHIYLSYFDRQQVRSIKAVLPDMQVPLLWLAGEDDRLTETLHMTEIFSHAREDGVSRYELLPGSHKGVTRSAPATIAKWIKSL
jgi:pimeloyl-ACP methyl ester carboxylesterase